MKEQRQEGGDERWDNKRRENKAKIRRESNLVKRVPRHHIVTCVIEWVLT
jgi:hypothetical protein